MGLIVMDPPLVPETKSWIELKKTCDFAMDYNYA